MADWKEHRKADVVEIRAYEEGEDLTGISLKFTLGPNGPIYIQPVKGDYIGRSIDNHNVMWHITKAEYKNYYF